MKEQSGSWEVELESEKPSQSCTFSLPLGPHADPDSLCNCLLQYFSLQIRFFAYLSVFPWLKSHPQTRCDHSIQVHTAIRLQSLWLHSDFLERDGDQPVQPTDRSLGVRCPLLLHQLWFMCHQHEQLRPLYKQGHGESGKFSEKWNRLDGVCKCVYV